MKRQWFYRLLLSYVPVFFIMVFVILFISFVKVNELFLQESVKANEKLSRKVMDTIDRTLQTTNGVILKEIETNNKIALFLHPENKDNVYLDYEISKSLRSFILSMPLIDSIYLVRLHDRMVISPNAKLPLEKYGDYEFANRVINSPFQFDWSNRRDFIEFSKVGQSRHVVTLVRRLPPLTGEDGFIVVNVGTNGINKLIEDTASMEISFIEVEDQQGQLLSENNNRDPSQANRDKQALAQLTSDYTHWTVSSGIENGTMYGWIFSMSNAVIVIFATFVLGIGWILFVSHQNYKPLQSIMLRISTYSKNIHFTKKGDEFKFIETALDKMIEFSHKYDTQNEQYTVLSRQRLFQVLMHGDRPVDMSEWQQTMRLFSLPEQFGELNVVVVEMDKYAKFCIEYNPRDQNLLKFVLSSVINETAGNHAVTVWTEWLSNKQLGVLFQFADIDRNNLHAIRQICEQVSTWVQENLYFTITAGIGTNVESIADLSSSYEAATEALKYKAALGGKRVIGFWEIDSNAFSEMYELLNMVRAIVTSFRLGKEDWIVQYEAFFQSLKIHLLSSDDLYSLLNYFVYHLDRELMKLPSPFQFSWKNVHYPSFHSALEGFESLEDIQRSFYKLLSETMTIMQEGYRSRNYSTLIQGVREYIEKHFAEPNMSLSLLSEKFQINEKYLSRLFKEEFGENFVDLLIRLRIQYSQKLLSETSSSIQEIATKVGYANSISFNRSFKKTTGITPGDFRKDTIS